MKMDGINYSCQGESHKATEKVCQDYSYFSSDNDTILAIVCDGHGGERYFRSDVGAKLAADVTSECVRQFIENCPSEMFVGKSFTQKYAKTTEAAHPELITKETQIDKALRQLFSAIICNWRNRILEHAHEVALSEWEKNNVQQKYLDSFVADIDLEKTYGCTLMCFVRTSTYWFAFHLGDGKCIAFDEKGTWSEPIPWDEKCFLNKTTSLCDSAAIDEFRYCYAGDGSCPIAWCLGSDGMDDSFGATENMVNFYIQFLKMIVDSPREEVQQQLEETLPELSRIGSKDDMSLVCVYDPDALAQTKPCLIDWQRKNVGIKITAINERILKMREAVARFESAELTNQKDMIDYQYAKKELTQAFVTKRNLVTKFDKFAQEINPTGYIPYTDEIGIYETPEDKKFAEAEQHNMEQEAQAETAEQEVITNEENS